MKAILFYQHGGPEVLQYGDFPTPQPQPGEALVRLRAAALNRMDVMVRNGWPGLKLDLPHINGADGAGEVIALGPSLPAAEGPKTTASPLPEGSGPGVKASPLPLGEGPGVKASPLPLG